MRKKKRTLRGDVLRKAMKDDSKPFSRAIIDDGKLKMKAETYKRIHPAAEACCKNHMKKN